MIAKPQTRTIIDTISAGYTALNRRLWIVLIPIAINLYLAYGAQVSLAPLLQQARLSLEKLVATASASGNDMSAMKLDQRLDRVDMRPVLLWFNYVPLLVQVGDEQLLQAAGSPTESSVAPVLDGGSGEMLVVQSPLQLLGVIAGLNIVAVVASGLFLQQLAAAAHTVVAGRAATEDLGLVGRRAGLIMFSWVLWVLLVALALVLLGLPFVILTTLIALVVPFMAELLLILGVIGIFWASIYIGFSVEAIALDGAGPVRAIRNSAAMVRQNFFGTLGLLLLSWLVAQGLGFVWQQLSGNPVGLLLACAASAYIGTGLAAARMVFYRERSKSVIRDT